MLSSTAPLNKWKLPKTYNRANISIAIKLRVTPTREKSHFAQKRNKNLSAQPHAFSEFGLSLNPSGFPFLLRHSLRGGIGIQAIP